jgi:hypothetical protein
LGRKKVYATEEERIAARHATVKAAAERFRARQRKMTPLQKEVGLDCYTPDELALVERLKKLESDITALAREINEAVTDRLVKTEGSEELLLFLTDGFTRLELPNY